MILIYGVTGYTGQLVLQEAARVGLSVVVAGRSAEKVRPLADAHRSEWRAFPVEAPQLDGARVVLNCAGPFSRTAGPMVDACLRVGAHYLDITGEIPVFEALAARGDEARAAGVGLLPGAGFDVVPTDCLSVHLARRLPGATSLRLALASAGGMSHGTATTMLEMAADGGLVRRGGRLERAGFASLRVDFGDKERDTMRIPWGDVSTAFHSTGIPDIEVYAAAPASAIAMARWGSWASAALRWGWLRDRLQARIDAAPPGPSDAARARGWARVWGEVRHPDGRVARARLRTPEGYTLTAIAAVEAARRAGDGALPAGFQTPATAFGPDFILGVPGCERTDEPG